MLDVQGILQSVQLASEQRTVLVPYLREIFINEAPLFSRLPHIYSPSQVYNIITYDVRQRQLTLAAAVGTGDASLSLSDASQLQVGDVLEVYNTNSTAYERVIVTADPNIGVTPNTVAVLRAQEGTTAVANTLGSNTNAILVGNARTGAEVAQTAMRSNRQSIQQCVQTSQFAVQVGGLAQAIGNVALPADISDVFSMEQKVQMTNMVRDVENMAYYGIGQIPVNPGDRGIQKGLRTQIGNYKGGLNVKLNAGASYTKLQYIADGPQKALQGGGNPDVMLVGLDWTAGFATWSVAQQTYTQPRQTPFIGIPIKEFETAFTGQPMTIIPSFQLRPGTIITLTSSDLKMRYVRPAFFQKRGLRGDAWEGDFIGDYCIELGHPGWHSWVEGVTSFSAN